MIRYFRTKKSKREHKGELFFAYDSEKNQVLQVREYPGEPKTGKRRMMGTYYIGRLTFLSNYYEYYVEEITYSIFINAFDRVQRKLKKYIG